MRLPLLLCPVAVGLLALPAPASAASPCGVSRARTLAASATVRVVVRTTTRPQGSVDEAFVCATRTGAAHRVLRATGPGHFRGALIAGSYAAVDYLSGVSGPYHGGQRLLVVNGRTGARVGSVALTGLEHCQCGGIFDYVLKPNGSFAWIEWPAAQGAENYSMSVHKVDGADRHETELQRWTDPTDFASTPISLALSRDGEAVYWSRRDGNGATRASIS
ncbi:MAG: hypothetical protein JWM73_2851 [Solirubrobacterales bacterium]|nr:hypothetical protein [Solirubrobacterales bacterium]